MKNTLTKKLQNYTLLAVTGSMLLNSGCKKDEEITDDPNVEFFDIPDLVVDAITSGEDEALLDIDKDGENDIGIYAYTESYEGNVYKVTYLAGIASGSAIASKKLVLNGEPYYFASDVGKGQSVKDLSFLTDYAYTSLISNDGVANINEGLQGKGDKYVGVRFKIGSGTHFGWLKVNVDNSGAKITIKEAAYHKVAGETLNAGDQ